MQRDRVFLFLYCRLQPLKWHPRPGVSKSQLSPAQRLGLLCRSQTAGKRSHASSIRLGLPSKLPKDDHTFIPILTNLNIKTPGPCEGIEVTESGVDARPAKLRLCTDCL